MCTVSDGVLLQVSVMYACVCVALIFAYTTRCATTRQVRRPLVRSESLPCPTELEALFLVCTSTPLVPLNSAPGRRGNGSDCLVVAHACFLVVHYIWRINGAPQGTRRELSGLGESAGLVSGAPLHMRARTVISSF